MRMRNLLAQLSGDNLPSDSTQLAKHQAGDFEYVLTLPAVTTPTENTDANDEKSVEVQEEVTTVQFGCNLVRADGESELVRRGSQGSAATYTLIATPIECSDNTRAEIAEPAAEKVQDMATATAAEVISVAEVPVPEVPGVEMPAPSQDAETTEKGDQVSRRGSEVTASQSPEQPNDHHGPNLGGIRNHPSRRTSEVLDDDDKDDVIDEIMSLPPAPSPGSRIEDSVEALDKLEEQLEAMNDLTQLGGVMSAEATKGAPASTKQNTAAKRTKAGSATPAPETASGTVHSKPVGRSVTVRHSVAIPPSKKMEQTAATQAAVSKRLSVASRPASLAPPKPLVRSSKPPTVSTFELPGEAVAQRLKEKRLARLSMSMPASAQTPGRTSSPTKPKTATSSKPPTRANFELPGEAISRRKREEREAKLKAEQEEERKLREFKARPVRASVVAGGTFPRQTAASRARMSLKADMVVEASPTIYMDALSTAKRHSTIGPGMSSRPSLSVSTGTSSLSRGRASVALTPSTAGISRTTSTSTGSARGSSTLSAEEMREQKIRGKEIFVRESSFVSEKECERRTREEAAKKAREEAAERSRKAGREWAEKQKARKMGTIRGSSSSAA